MSTEFECKQCGKCCKKYVGTLIATVEDIRRWEKEDRDDILKYVDIYEFGDKISGGDLWFDPKTGEELSLCPFLKKINGKFICLINDTKPAVCKKYPFDDDGRIKADAKNICSGIKERK